LRLYNHQEQNAEILSYSLKYYFLGCYGAGMHKCQLLLHPNVEILIMQDEAMADLGSNMQH
jgi:hypothetical protein